MPAIIRIFHFLGAALLAVALPHAAAAAPQMLALLATVEATTLRCEDGICGGQFSGFCLQRERPNPQPGTAYRAQGGALTLVLTGADGAAWRVPAGDFVAIATQRGYTAVRISLPEDLLRKWGAVSAALEVGERVTLAPVPVAGDANPQSEAENALALGPQRALGERIVSQSVVESGAVRLTGALVNALPPLGRTSREGRQALWDEVAAPRGAAYPRAAVESARALYDRCLAKVERGLFFSLRKCLEAGHDSIMLDLNFKYWEAGADS